MNHRNRREDLTLKHTWPFSCYFFDLQPQTPWMSNSSIFNLWMQTCTSKSPRYFQIFLFKLGLRLESPWVSTYSHPSFSGSHCGTCRSLILWINLINPLSQLHIFCWLYSSERPLYRWVFISDKETLNYLIIIVDSLTFYGLNYVCFVYYKTFAFRCVHAKDC